MKHFKIIHKESPIYLHDLVNIKKHNYSFRYENTADVPSVKTRLWSEIIPLFFNQTME